MRVLATIMSFIVLFLSVQPAFSSMEEKQMDQCCAGSCHTDSSKSKETPAKNSCGDNCNPFQSCSSCVGFTLVSYQIEIAECAFTENQINYTNQVHPQFSQFIPDFWQPPKIV